MRGKRTGRTLCLALMLLACAQVALAASEKVGYLSDVWGDKAELKIFRSTNLRWVGAGRNTPLFPGDKVRTGPNSKCKLFIFSKRNEKDLIEVCQNTVFEIPDVPENEGGVGWVGMFSNAIGSIYASIRRRISGDSEGFNVKTPTVVAGVRGTKFDVKYDNKKRRTFVGLKSGTLKIVTVGAILAATLSRSNPRFQVDAYRAAQLALGVTAMAEIDKRAASAHAHWENRDHILFVTKGNVLCGGKVVDNKWWNRRLDLDATTPENRIRLEVTDPKGMVAFSFDRTGRLELRGKGFVDLFKIGNEIFVYLDEGDLRYRREGEWIPGGMKLIGKRRQSGRALYDVSILTDAERIQDYSPKGVRTQLRVNKSAAATIIDCVVGQVKVSALDV